VSVRELLERGEGGTLGAVAVALHRLKAAGLVRKASWRTWQLVTPRRLGSGS